MGASDFAALIASVFISMWTQRSYKEPLLFSSIMCITGNMMFLLSYFQKSFPLLILARLFNGLGSARTANRRYTADFVSKKQRTMASAAFVGASNFGQALGPLLSVPTALLPDDFVLLGVPVNAVTAVGYSMALLWLLFFIFGILYFEEPSKATPIGLRPAESKTIQTHALMQQGINGESSSLREPLMPQNGAEEESSSSLQHQPSASGSNYSSDEVQGFHKASERARRDEWIPTVVPTLATISCLFVQKLIQQAYSDGVPLFLGGVYLWNTRKTSLWLGFVGLLGVPCNLLIGIISSHVYDRTMVLWSVVLSALSLVWLRHAVENAGAYFGGGTVLFLATIALEGTATSLMSKVIWHGFARGVFNAGLLSTEAGTLGRFTGNSLLTLVGRYTGVEDRRELDRFAHLLHDTMGWICVALLVQLASAYQTLTG